MNETLRPDGGGSAVSAQTVATAKPAGHRKAARGLRLPRRFRGRKPGSAPGIEVAELAGMASAPERARITCIDYGEGESLACEVTDVEEFVGRHRPEWSAVRWINVDGLSDMRVIRALAGKYHLHPLAIEDLLHVPQRPKLDVYPGEGEFQARLLVIARMIELKNNQLHSEQISIFIGHKTVLTFQETPGDVWDPVRQRIATVGSTLRQRDAGFLAYTLIDAIVDHCFPLLEFYGDTLEDLETLVLERPDRRSIQEIHRVKRELLLLRRAVWPMREVVHRLQRQPHECFGDDARTYMRDVYDHTVQIIDIVETYREVAMSLTETYMTALSNRMNEIMKVLTMIGTIFIPLTFLAGVYGMNFRHFPELDWPWSYPVFWAVCAVTVATMTIWFRRKGWL